MREAFASFAAGEAAMQGRIRTEASGVKLSTLGAGIPAPTSGRCGLAGRGAGGARLLDSSALGIAPQDSAAWTLVRNTHPASRHQR